MKSFAALEESPNEWESDKKFRWRQDRASFAGMSKRGRLYGCPVELALDLLGGKWKTVILARIKEGPARYSDLRRMIPSLSDKMLSQRLGDLVEIGFIRLEAGVDGKERYGLTDVGRALTGTLQALHDWGEAQGSAAGVRFRSALTIQG